MVSRKNCIQQIELRLLQAKGKGFSCILFDKHTRMNIGDVLHGERVELSVVFQTKWSDAADNIWNDPTNTLSPRPLRDPMAPRPKESSLWYPSATNSDTTQSEAATCGSHNMEAKPAHEDGPATEAQLLSNFHSFAAEANKWNHACQILLDNAANTELRHKLANYQQSSSVHKKGPSPLEFVALHFLYYNPKAEAETKNQIAYVQELIAAGANPFILRNRTRGDCEPEITVEDLFDKLMNSGKPAKLICEAIREAVAKHKNELS